MCVAFVIVTMTVCDPSGSAADLAKMAMIKICSQVSSASHTARYNHPFIYPVFHSLSYNPMCILILHFVFGKFGNILQ